jgi:methylated-DNA-[protein]-cysteine S-methyltransferase
MRKFYTTINTKISPLTLVADEKALLELHFQNYTPSDALQSVAHPVIVKTINQLQEYFSGQRQSFDLPLSPEGTAFQQQVWKALQTIKFGKAISYKDLAKKVKNEKAFRAVGSANGKNPLPIIIPCHRVIAADGTIGGYSGGLAIKKRLLDLEGFKLAG